MKNARLTLRCSYTQASCRFLHCSPGHNLSRPPPSRASTICSRGAQTLCICRALSCILTYILLRPLCVWNNVARAGSEATSASAPAFDLADLRRVTEIKGRRSAQSGCRHVCSKNLIHCSYTVLCFIGCAALPPSGQELKMK